MLKKICIPAVSVILFSQCALFFRTSIPIRTIYHQTAKTAKADTLVIFLPGRHSTPGDFAVNGFVTILKKSGKNIDSVAVDAHLGYYIKRNLLERLRLDIVNPARKNGYKKIWLVGISMGGIGTLLYNEKYNNTIDGVVVLAPFLGDEEVIAEISAAGGLVKWSPGKIEKDDYQRKLWLWLKNYTKASHSLPKLVIGYGRSDRFAKANKLLAEVLPKKNVYTVAGGHDWGPWKKLFTYFAKQKEIFK